MPSLLDLARPGIAPAGGAGSTLQSLASGAQPQSPVTQSPGFMFRPFNPDERRNNPDGSYSTEISRTVQIGDSFANVPSLWKNAESGQTVDLGKMSDDQLAEFADKFEAATGNQFARFRSVDEAVSAAQQRSQMGGAAAGNRYSPQQ